MKKISYSKTSKTHTIIHTKNNLYCTLGRSWWWYVTFGI